MATDKEIKNWLKRMSNIIKTMPDGVEAHVGYGVMTIYEAGRMSQHIGSTDDDGGINDDSALESILFDRKKLIPYSEGT